MSSHDTYPRLRIDLRRLTVRADAPHMRRKRLMSGEAAEPPTHARVGCGARRVRVAQHHSAARRGGAPRPCARSHGAWAHAGRGGAASRRTSCTSIRRERYARDIVRQ